MCLNAWIIHIVQILIPMTVTAEIQTGLQRSYGMLSLNTVRNILTWYDRFIFFFLLDFSDTLYIIFSCSKCFLFNAIELLCVYVFCNLYSRIVLKVQCVNIIIFLPIIVSHVPASQPAWHGLKSIDILVLLVFLFFWSIQWNQWGPMSFRHISFYLIYPFSL